MLTNRLKASCASNRSYIVACISVVVVLILIGISRRDDVRGLINNKNSNDESFSEEFESYPDESPTSRKRPDGEKIEYELTEPEGHSNKKTAKTIADALLSDLMKKIGNGRGPIIVGGIGDSGTRGVREVLQNFGSEMLKYPLVTSVSRDSEIFMAPYETTTTKGHTWIRKPASIYGKAISTIHSLKFNESTTNFDFWHTARQFVAKMVSKSMDMSQRSRGSRDTLDPWGFKHPRTSLLLPIFITSLHNKFMFVHVIRDGKDVIEGDNQRFFVEMCPKYYGRPCRNIRPQRASFWADMNREIFEIVLNSKMRPEQYIAIRSEDLVLGNERCFRRLAHFLRIPTDKMGEVIKHSIEANKGHEGSYFGNHWDQTEREDVETSFITHAQETIDALKFWGYNVDKYPLALDCESLPWMKRIREKKGSLPGDGSVKKTDVYRFAPEEVLLRQDQPRNMTKRGTRAPTTEDENRHDPESDGDL